MNKVIEIQIWPKATTSNPLINSNDYNRCLKLDSGYGKNKCFIISLCCVKEISLVCYVIKIDTVFGGRNFKQCFVLASDK